MNDAAADALALSGRPDQSGGLAPGLRALAEGGIEVRGEVVVWPGGGTWADAPPGRYGDLTGWECAVNAFHLEDEVPVTVEVSAGGEPSIARDAQVVLLRQGLALGMALCRSAARLEPSVALRCLVAVGGTNATFRFHRVRVGEDWVAADLDGYVSEMVAVVESPSIA